MFRIGQKVICVDVKWEVVPNPLHTMPVKGSVYTIRGWEDLFEGAGVLLVEIVNPIFAEERYFAQGKYMEIHFANYHFRPISTIDYEEYESCEKEYVSNN